MENEIRTIPSATSNKAGAWWRSVGVIKEQPGRLMPTLPHWQQTAEQKMGLGHQVCFAPGQNTLGMEQVPGGMSLLQDFPH